MPNWCSNQVTLTGPKNVISEILETKLSLQEIFPCPQELKDTESPAKFNDKEKAISNKEKYGFQDWYDWQVANWGTKWDIGPIENLTMDENGDGTYTIYTLFDSAWSPPVEAFKNLYEKYKSQGLELHLEYFESGCRFLGTATGSDGHFNDEYFEYSNADELEEAVKELDHGLAESEVEYLREIEAEEDSEDNN